MNHSLKLSFVLASLALGACSPHVSIVDSGQEEDVSSQDAASTDATPDAQACIGTPPPANAAYCAMNGCPFQPITLPTCDGQGDYNFYGPDFCTATATLLVISAGWCVPCMQEAPMIEQLVTQAYHDRGVRVITVYAQNPDGSTPVDHNCLMWRDSFHLTSHMTRDPNGVTQPYTPQNAFPSNVIIDQNGNVYDVLYGTEQGLTTLTGDLDAILQAEGR